VQKEEVKDAESNRNEEYIQPCPQVTPVQIVAQDQGSEQEKAERNKGEEIAPEGDAAFAADPAFRAGEQEPCEKQKAKDEQKNQKKGGGESKTMIENREG
jgi:hypothetical protein